MRLMVLFLVVLLLSGVFGCREQTKTGEVETPRLRFGEDFPVISPNAPAEAYQPATMPQQSLKIYMEALSLGTRDRALPLYTPASRELLARVPTSVEAQARELALLKRSVTAHLVEMEKNLSVIRFPVKEWLSPPYLFRAGETGWELDLAAMDELISLESDGRWRFRRLDHEYMFAFGKQRFDKDGYLSR